VQQRHVLSSRKSAVRVARVVIFAVLTPVLLNSLGVLNRLPNAYALTYNCSDQYSSQDPGAPSSGYYYDWADSGNTGEYGVYGELQATSWTYDGDTSGHEALYVNMGFSNAWAQSGDVAGVLPGNSYSSTRYPYLEYKTPSGSYEAYIESSYPVSGTGVYTIGEDYIDSYSGGSYYYTLSIYSSHYGDTWFVSNINFGSDGTTDPATASETYYTQTSETCDSYVNYSTSLAYSSSASSSPSWTSWSSSSLAYSDINYTYYQVSATSWIWCSQNYASTCT
jgi:hypothetical protein